MNIDNYEGEICNNSSIREISMMYTRVVCDDILPIQNTCSKNH